MASSEVDQRIDAVTRIVAIPETSRAGGRRSSGNENSPRRQWLAGVVSMGGEAGSGAAKNAGADSRAADERQRAGARPAGSSMKAGRGRPKGGRGYLSFLS